MALKNDSSLKYLLLALHELASSDVAPHFMDALELMSRSEIKQMITDNPQVTAAEILTHFEQTGRRVAQFVKARRAGHYGAFRIRSENMA